MNRETLFTLLFVLLSFISAQAAWKWARIEKATSISATDASYVDLYTILMAGRTYSIVVYGTDGLDTTLTAKDPSGHQDFNDDYGGSYSSNGVSYAGSSALMFTPAQNGLTILTVRPATPTASWSATVFILETTSCSSCIGCQMLSWSINCPFCPSGKKCSSCEVGKSRFGSTCLTTCIDGTYEDSNSVCQQCSYVHDFCLTCTLTTCSSCVSGYVFHQDNCRSSCPVGYYNNGGTCAACSTKTQGCSECSESTGDCTACESGWYFYAGKCLTTCPDGRYPNSNGNVCSACISLDSSCTKCSSSTTCLECSGGRFPEGKNCVTSCSPGYFQNNDKCSSCSLLHNLCTSCSSSITCTGCSSGVASGADCLSSCGTGTFNENGICQPCAKKTVSCSTCNPSSGLCSSCVSGWYLYSNLCYKTCPSGTYPKGNMCVSCSGLDPACTKCDSSTNCLECSGGLAEEGQCVLSCSAKYFEKDGVCRPCSQLHPFCNKCSSSTQCTGCTLASGLVASGASCVNSCDSGFWKDNGVCRPCATKTQGCIDCYENDGTCTTCESGWYYYNHGCDTTCPLGLYPDGNQCSDCSIAMDSCSTCTSSTVCTGCSGGKFLEDHKCVSTCSAGYFKYKSICRSCSMVDNNCILCDSLKKCTKCSSGYASGSQCVPSCPSGTYGKDGTCISCTTINPECLTCGGPAQCFTCDNGKFASWASCLTECPSGYYPGSGNVCQSCSTLNSYCSVCSSSTNCESCSPPYYAFGSRCESTCPIGTYADDLTRKCLACSALNSFCTSCVNDKTCTACSHNRFAYGLACVTSCPQGTANNGGICTAVSLKVFLTNTENVNNYLVQITPALVYDVQVPVVSKVILVGIDPSAYSYTLTRQSETIYLISIKNTQTISSTTLKFIYSLTGSPSTKNINIGDWTDQIPSKYMAYISEGAKKAAEAVSSVAGGSMQGASVGAGSMAIIGGNPALLWTLMNLFQAFYYLSFIDVNYPANVQMFFEIFSMGSLSFIPNPLDWFVNDIEAYSLPVPQRYNDQDFSGLFLDNAGNELMMLFFVFVIFCICKMMKKWLRRLPTSLRFASEKTIGWFQWSGVLESLTTSYTDIAQAVFLQLKVLTFSSTVFSLSSILCIVTLGYVVAFPILVIGIIRKFSDHPELLTIQYETLVKDYNLDKVSARNFVPIWLIRRLIMCLSLVFLHGYPYVQINVLSLLQIAGIFYCWVYTPYTTRKENICNTLIEIMFGFIHVVIYILIYDDHNPSFSEEQRLQFGWAIVLFCGAILILSLGMSIFEQVRMIIRGLRMLKQLMSKKDKVKVKVNKEDRLKSKNVELSPMTLADQSTLVELNKTPIDILSFTSPNMMRAGMRSSPAPRNQIVEKKLRRARLASRIRELRAINS